MSNAVKSVVDVNERDFGSAVLEQSRRVPVVVDFWAPWCGPCRVLGPTLERLAAEANGAWVLAKINVDENPRISQQFGIQGIPAVKAFRDGAVVNEFVGAQPESNVRAWLAQIVPSQEEQLIAEAVRREASDPAGAAMRYRRVLGRDPAHGAALLGLGRVLTLQNDPEAAEVLRQIKPGTPEHAKAQALLDLSSLLAAGTGTVADAQQQLAGEPNNTLARWQLAAALARQQQWPDALRHLLTIVQRDRGFGDDAARRAMLAIFAVLGEHDPQVAYYRQQLASALF
jgi:putative thioredoxin